MSLAEVSTAWKVSFVSWFPATEALVFPTRRILKFEDSAEKIEGLGNTISFQVNIKDLITWYGLIGLNGTEPEFFVGPEVHMTSQSLEF